MDKIFETKGRKRNVYHKELEGINTKGDIIIIADLSLWNGHRLGYRKCGHNIEELLISNYDLEVYCDNYDLRANEKHHDGTNKILFREIKPELTARQRMNFFRKLAKNDLSKVGLYTNSLVNYVGGV